jgi:hypothetical protein
MDRDACGRREAKAQLIALYAEDSDGDIIANLYRLT